MDIMERVNILKNAGVLCEQNYLHVVSVIEYFKHEKNIELTEENSAAFITHLCMALERIDKEEEVEPLDREIYETASQEPGFEKASVCCRDIREILPQLSDAEVEYICVHVGVMLARY